VPEKVIRQDAPILGKLCPNSAQTPTRGTFRVPRVPLARGLRAYAPHRADRAAFEKPLFGVYRRCERVRLVPRATLEIPTSQRRLERILRLIQQCAFSIHDLSRVQFDARAPRVPLFNMPFELGLAVAQDARNRRETWYVCETVPYRISKSLSDLNVTDVRIHVGTVRGVFGALCDIFVRKTRQPSVHDMYRIYLFDITETK
jgi:hypothetical protein